MLKLFSIERVSCGFGRCQLAQTAGTVLGSRCRRICPPASVELDGEGCLFLHMELPDSVLPSRGQQVDSLNGATCHWPPHTTARRLKVRGDDAMIALACRCCNCSIPCMDLPLSSLGSGPEVILQFERRLPTKEHLTCLGTSERAARPWPIHSPSGQANGWFVSIQASR